MRISLNNLIQQYYKQLNYLGTSYSKKHKQFIQVGNFEFAQAIIMHYDNLKMVYTISQYTPEIKKSIYYIEIRREEIIWTNMK